MLIILVCSMAQQTGSKVQHQYFFCQMREQARRKSILWQKWSFLPFLRPVYNLVPPASPSYEVFVPALYLRSVPVISPVPPPDIFVPLLVLQCSVITQLVTLPQLHWQTCRVVNDWFGWFQIQTKPTRPRRARSQTVLPRRWMRSECDHACIIYSLFQ